MSFADELREDMSRYDLTIREVARGARVNRLTVRRWLTGESEPQRSTRERYDDFIGIQEHRHNPPLYDALSDMGPAERECLLADINSRQGYDAIW